MLKKLRKTLQGFVPRCVGLCYFLAFSTFIH